MTSPSSHLRTVLDRLPFAVDDMEAANDAFRRWVERGEEEAKRLVDLWTYCYVCRYFLSKAARGEFTQPAAADELITRAYQRVEDHRDGVRDPDRYANWVSVVCKNTFLNRMRSDRVAESIDDEKGPTIEADADRTVAEVGFVREAFVSAIDQLPDYLQEPARLYFLGGEGVRGNQRRDRQARPHSAHLQTQGCKAASAERDAPGIRRPSRPVTSDSSV